MNVYAWSTQGRSHTQAIDAESDLPDFEVLPLKASQVGKDGESACGEIMRRKGRVKTKGSVEGIPLDLTWDVMAVKVPIVSVRKLVRDSHNVFFQHHGGFIRNLITGAEIPFFEYQGVYYMKYKVNSPDTDPVKPVVGRPVP